MKLENENINCKTMEFYKDIETKFLRADELINSGEFLRAKELLEEILEEEPDYGRAHNHMGVIYMNALADFPCSAEYFRLVIKFAPEYSVAYHNYAAVLLEMGELDKVESCVRKSLKVSGVDKGWMYHKLACVYELRKKYQEAFNFLKISREHALNDYWYSFIRKEMKRVRRKMGWIRQVSLLL